MKSIEELTVDMLEELDLPGDFPVGFTVREMKGPESQIAGYVYTDPQKDLVVKIYGYGFVPIPEGTIGASYVRALLRTVTESLDIVRRKR